MALDKYNEKRNFSSTAEPKGEIQKSSDKLIFVVQKHAASRLHYDFRIEAEGVLKSWAVPKGPSMNPKDKRLAMMVEDHPYSYKDFEGNIPEGNYGAGNVIVWDTGTYESINDESTDDFEKSIVEGIDKGQIKFILTGKKLKGEFALVKIHGKDENAWLIIKKEDKYSSDEDILRLDKSVISDESLDSLEKKYPKKKLTKSTKSPGKSKTMVTFMEPMLATLFDKPFDDKDWIFEIKYDGYRTIAVLNQSHVELFSRNQLSFNEKFATIVEDLKSLDHIAVLDGEVVIEDENGRSDFQLLQNYIKSGEGYLKYYVFDILNLDGNDIRNINLLERKELLKIMLKKKLRHTVYSDHILEKGKSFFELAVKNKLEGIIGKLANSVYSSGKRTNEWLKIKITNEDEAIIIGITEPKGSRKHFGSLVLAQYQGKQLKYIGNCGTGFDQNDLAGLFYAFKKYFTDQPPLPEKIKEIGSIQWMKPELICRVKYSEITREGHLRHPVFMGLRIDKEVSDVTVQNLETRIPEQEATKAGKPIKNKAENEYTVKRGSRILQFTNQKKVYFPDDNITKGDLVNYYNEIGNIILPYLHNRPQSMNRFPNGINGKSFFQKDLDIDKIPKWLKTEKIYSDSNNDYIDYLICNDVYTLLYMANLGCIEINPWNSSITNIENPDWMVMDLDPDDIAFQEVVTTALTVRRILDELEIPSYCKTSGKTGLHVYIPLAAKYSYDTVKIFSEMIASMVHDSLPQTTSIERPVKKRIGKVYVDFLQNRRGQTLAAPYSVRPTKGAAVSTPLEWSEVNKKLSPLQFTMRNILKRIEKKGDLWKPVISKGADIEKVIKMISSQ